MKRGQFQAERAAFWGKFLADGVVSVGLDTLVLRDVAAAEAAGVKWDPEEEPMAERLGLLGGALWAARKDGAALREATAAELLCAIALYNRRPDFERIAQEMTALHDRLIHSSAIHFGETAAAVSDWIDHLRSPIQ